MPSPVTTTKAAGHPAHAVRVPSDHLAKGAGNHTPDAAAAKVWLAFFAVFNYS
jgi:hypothetical protein